MNNDQFNNQQSQQQMLMQQLIAQQQMQAQSRGNPVQGMNQFHGQMPAQGIPQQQP